MVESVGKKLHQARLQQGLTIDEAAHATKLRPDKIAALENDDYSRFANNIYARGFLQIYGRFLKVDVEDFARTLDNANPISISDYQYLSNAPAAVRETMPIRREEHAPPSLAPLFFFIALIALGAGGSWVYQNSARLKGEPAVKSPAAREIVATPTPNPDAAFVMEGPLPTPLPKTANRPATPGSTPAGKPPERDFVTPSPVATGDPSTRPPGVNEVLVATVKKTWVTVRKDDPKAKPIFEDYVYPNASPLKLKGARFFIEARDPAAVQITKNGLPYAYQPSGVPVQ